MKKKGYIYKSDKENYKNMLTNIINYSLKITGKSITNYNSTDLGLIILKKYL